MRGAWLITTTLACGASPLPNPPFVGQPTSALEVVPYPPPPARIEAVPPRPRKNATWIDGEWTWRSVRWLWMRGRWIVAPSGARYSPWTLTHTSDGKLYEARGTWRNARGEAIEPPKPLAVADVSEGVVIDTAGDSLAPGRTLPAPGETQDQEVAQ